MLPDISAFNLTGFANLQDFVIYMVSFAMGIAVVIAVVSLILSGFKYILSFGDEDKVKSATQSMLYSLIGLALVFIAPAIVRYIISILLK